MSTKQQGNRKASIEEDLKKALDKDYLNPMGHAFSALGLAASIFAYLSGRTIDMVPMFLAFFGLLISDMYLKMEGNEIRKGYKSKDDFEPWMRQYDEKKEPIPTRWELSEYKKNKV
jgi:hypothetical protein